VLSVGAQVAGRPIERVIARLNPFLVALTVCMLVVIFTPGLSLWLPEALGLM
jgi:TRAP-type C4-dicarboxylate transport system permease large subunit